MKKPKTPDGVQTAVSYARFSSDRQHESSIEAQEDAVNRWAQEKQVQIVRRYADRGISGRTDRRPEFQRMISELKDQPVDYVLVHKFDRFARNQYDAAIYRREITKRGAQLVAVAQDFGRSPEAVIIESLLQGMAEYYSLNLGTEVLKGRRIRIKKGLFPGGPTPFGYRVEDGRLVPEPIEAHYIRLAYQSVLTGVPPRHELLRQMNEAGMRTRMARRPFISKDISRLLRNTVYIGTYEANAGEEHVVIPDNHPALVSKDVFTEVNKKMDRKIASGRRREARQYLLTPVLVCGECGKNMRGMTARSRPHKDGTPSKPSPRYWCYNAPVCRLGSVNAIYLERLACDYVNQLLSEDIREQLTRKMMDYVETRSQTIRQRKPRNTQELNRLKKRHDAIIENMCSGALDQDTLAILNEQLKQVRIQMDVLRAENTVQDIQLSEEKIRGYFEAASQIDPEKNFALAQQMILRFIERIVVSKTEIVIEPTMERWLNETFPQLSQPHAENAEKDSADFQLEGNYWKPAESTLMRAGVEFGSVNIAQKVRELAKN